MSRDRSHGVSRPHCPQTRKLQAKFVGKQIPPGKRRRFRPDMPRRGVTYGKTPVAVQVYRSVPQSIGLASFDGQYGLLHEPENTPRARSTEDILRVLRALHRNGRGMRTRIRMAKLMRALPYREGYVERFGYVFHKSGEFIPRTMPVHTEPDNPELGYDEETAREMQELTVIPAHHLAWLREVPGVSWGEGEVGGRRIVIPPRWLVRFWGIALSSMYAPEKVMKASLQYGAKRLRDPGVRGTWETILAVAGTSTALAWLHAMARRRPVRDQQFIFPDALKAFS